MGLQPGAAMKWRNWCAILTPWPSASKTTVNAQARLLNDISHELRSPLARLNVASALAHQRAGAEARSALERIDLEAERLNELIGGLLTIARLDSGSDSRQKSPILLGEMVEGIAADANFEAQAHNSGVECVIKEDCVVVGAPILLHSAIENVVRNAARYTEPGTSARSHAGERPGERRSRRPSCGSLTRAQVSPKKLWTSSFARSTGSTTLVAARPAE